MKKILLLILIYLPTLQINAQVNDISFNLTPTANHTWWDNQLFIEDGLMVGGMVGVGLGKHLELRGIYEQSIDLKSTLNNLNVPADIVDQFNSRTVDVTRWGGEFKANIPTGGWLAPYLTLGTGVQKLKFDDLKEEQIYVSGGLGTKFNLGDRVTLNLEGKLHAFNLDPSNILRVNNPDEDPFNDWIDNNITNDRMMNWSFNVGVQFYLGGRNPKSYTALERAIGENYSNDYDGLRFVVEPGGAYISFDDDTNLKNTYLLGGALGLDFNDYLGLRGFYYRSIKEEKISTDMDDLSIYGGDFIAKLNVARGVVPYISIGGGYMNVYDSYVGRNPLLAANSGYFAKGGVGLSIPIARYFEIFGGANLMLTTDREDPEDLQSPEDLKKHVMYNVGLKFNIGKSINSKRVLDSYVQQNVDDKTMMYQQRINELKRELDEAYEANDSEKASRIITEKQRLETEIVASTDKQRIGATTSTLSSGESMIRMTPAELESLVDQVVKGVGTPKLKEETPEERLDRLEKIVLGGNVNTYSQQPASTQSQTFSQQSPEVYVPESINNSNDELLKELQRINTKIEDNSRKIDNSYRQQTGSDKTFIVSPGGNQTPYGAPMGRDNIIVSPDGTRQNVVRQNQGVATSWVIYKGLSPFLGFTFGEATALVFGIKANYGFSNTDFVFTPDLYFGVGGKTAYGINANVTYPLFTNNFSNFEPYVGLGLGLNRVDKFSFGVNVIAGTQLNIGNGSMFVEYTSRRFFKNNQLSLGYRFDF
ncbi:MAG: hypothetical protein PHI32_10055 [Dysgonamonadaceae bacterium]|nr:hypothetical protein [Dysgonamonadaceae bacterium]MDD4728347.1 hypothetical protein [Dysgonamonadaceae bacterium]